MDSIKYAYKMSLGDFSTSDFGEEYVWLVWLIFLLSSLFLIIVMLNLIIAIMGDAYAQISETEEAAIWKEKLELMNENAFLVNREKVFAGVCYLVTVKSPT